MRDGIRAEKRAYPRRCGGTYDLVSPSADVAGLSPQVRGNPGWSPSRARSRGPIPAGAGEPVVGAGSVGGSVAYPRRCGGTISSTTMRPADLGLSPQVRGNPGWSPSRARSRGPIPAGAGEPLFGAAGRRRGRAYPRRCGGTAGDGALQNAVPGLSPQVRGNLLKVRHWCCLIYDVKEREKRLFALPFLAGCDARVTRCHERQFLSAAHLSSQAQGHRWRRCRPRS